jgi:hypothetical protein
MSTDTRTQTELLAVDIGEIRRIIEENLAVFHALGDLSDLNRQNYLSVIADLTWRALYHAMGVNELLNKELRDPLTVVQRALFETLTSLGYLNSQTNPEEEALILRAYTHLKQIRLFPDQPEVVNECQQLLQRMPLKAVALAQQRLKKWPYTWSGKTIKQMTEPGKIAGYATTYSYLSAEAHVGIIGERVNLIDLGDGTGNITFGRDIPVEEMEAHANFARRAVKHAFKIMWAVFDGPAVQLRSPDPDEWEKPIPTLGAGEKRT